MPVPEIIKPDSHVFCYSEDLLVASNKLAYYLGCKVSKVYEKKCDVNSYSTAWLVGHGHGTDTIVGDIDGEGYRIRLISEWLKNNREGRDYKYLVDTCCSPNRRKRSQTFQHNYYCTDDSNIVKVITDYNGLNDWWDDNDMHQY